MAAGAGDAGSALCLPPRSLVLGVTGNALDEDVRAFTRAGADAVVTKPVSTARLAAVVHEYLARRARAAGGPASTATV